MRTKESGFTLTEMMTAIALFSLVIVGVVYSHLVGLRFLNITLAKCKAGASARTALNAVREDVRSAKTLYVGYGSDTRFTNIADSLPQQGNALQIYPTSDTNVFVRYYLDPDYQQLNRVSNSETQPRTIASYVTNHVPFRAEDFAGNTLTNSQNNRIISLTLELCQWEFQMAGSGDQAPYDYFRLQTKAARRAIE